MEFSSPTAAALAEQLPDCSCSGFCQSDCRHDYNSIPSAAASEARAAATSAQLDAVSSAAAEASRQADPVTQRPPQEEPVHPAVAARIDHILNFAGQQEGPFRVSSCWPCICRVLDDDMLVLAELMGCPPPSWSFYQMLIAHDRWA